MVTPDGRRVVSASWDNTLKVWDLESGRELHILRGHLSSVSAVVVTPDGRRAVSASADGTLRCGICNDIVASQASFKMHPCSA